MVRHRHGEVGRPLVHPGAEQVTYAGLGNVEALLRLPGRTERPIAYRGIIGGAARAARSFTLSLEPGWLLVLHTDGVSGRFAAELDDLAMLEAQTLAEALVARWGRAADDASAVVLRAG